MNDFKTKAIEQDKRFFPVRDCSICGYMMGYVVLSADHSNLGFDTGCDCVTYSNINHSNWDEMKNMYESQTDKGKAILDKQWWGDDE